MKSIILQPTGKENFKDDSTMAIGIDLSQIQRFINKKDFEEISKIYKNGKAYLWGDRPGVSNEREWNKIKIGDIALFYGKKKFFTSATVTYKIRNSNLARNLWGENKEGETWEYIYFLDEIRRQSIDIDTFNTLLGYKIDNTIRGFRLLDEEKSDIVMNTFEFDSTTHVPAITKEQAEKDLEVVINELEQNSSMEREVTGRARREQNIIRGYLFGIKKTCNCGICGEEYPVDLLVAAHIKKRAHCSRQEKLDIKHIAIPMCKFGCDDLFEKGYIGVQKGEVISLVDTKYLPKSVKGYIENIQGKTCDRWNIDNDKYFEWHTNYHIKEI
ncbi:TPA: HNH endonuclease [Bacillus cereus]|nr:HNH endonuclease [Bacillus cereus]HDR7164634.1 HNH endonuclease [Bacillus cereus]